MPLLLDLFCGAGGCSVGYHSAGFEVVGVDINPQPRYPFEFHEADALEYLMEHYKDFDVIHASPPCQKYSRITKMNGTQDNHPDLLQPTVDALVATSKPYVVENVPGSPMTNYLMLCGTMFGLRVFRHRWFMNNLGMMISPASCNHHSRSSNGGKNGDQRHPEGEFITVTGSVSPIAKAKKAMGINWMKRHEIVEAIPPAYTEWKRECHDLIAAKEVSHHLSSSAWNYLLSSERQAHRESTAYAESVTIVIWILHNVPIPCLCPVAATIYSSRRKNAIFTYSLRLLGCGHGLGKKLSSLLDKGHYLTKSACLCALSMLDQVSKGTDSCHIM